MPTSNEQSAVTVWGTGFLFPGSEATRVWSWPFISV